MQRCQSGGLGDVTFKPVPPPGCHRQLSPDHSNLHLTHHINTRGSHLADLYARSLFCPYGSSKSPVRGSRSIALHFLIPAFAYKHLPSGSRPGQARWILRRERYTSYRPLLLPITTIHHFSYHLLCRIAVTLLGRLLHSRHARHTSARLHDSLASYIGLGSTAGCYATSPATTTTTALRRHAPTLSSHHTRMQSARSRASLATTVPLHLRGAFFPITGSA